MKDMNFDRIGDDLVQAYEEGYQEGLKENKILADAENRKFELLQKQVLDWAEEKDLLHEENAEKQFMKFIEEVFEFYKELVSYKEACTFFEVFGERYDDDAGQEYMELEMGDIFVTLIILCKQLYIDPAECLSKAYSKIESREGKTINGVFIKSEDL